MNEIFFGSRRDFAGCFYFKKMKLSPKSAVYTANLNKPDREGNFH